MKVSTPGTRAQLRAVALVTALSAVALPSAQAQSARLQAWVGCWSAEQTIVPTVSTIGPIVCITPTADANVVDVATLQEGKIISREMLDANGRERPVEAKGCIGTQRANWSADGRRVYLKSAGSCEGVARSTSGILAFTPSGEWLDIKGVTAGEGGTVRVARYHDIGVPRTVPAEIANALVGHDLSTQSARIAAGAPLRTSDVVEASRAIDSTVVEAWLLERGQRFELSARDLVKLADDGVPARVTDALVAVSNPQAFALARTDESMLRRGDVTDLDGPRRVRVYADPYGMPYGWGYSPYGYGYGSAYRYGYGYGNSYGGSYGYPGFYNPPIVIVNGQNAAHGKMVKGEGYKRGTSSASAPSSSSGTRSSQPSSTGSSRSPEPSSSGTRTAKPRD
jgi:hypothetical protein